MVKDVLVLNNGPIHQHMPCFVAIEDLVARTVLLHVHNYTCVT